MATSSTFPQFVVTFHRNRVKGTIRVRARDKRRAKNLARLRLGGGITILCAFRWKEHLERIRPKSKRPVKDGPPLEKEIFR